VPLSSCHASPFRKTRWNQSHLALNSSTFRGSARAAVAFSKRTSDSTSRISSTFLAASLTNETARSNALVICRGQASRLSPQPWPASSPSSLGGSGPRRNRGCQKPPECRFRGGALVQLVHFITTSHSLSGRDSRGIPPRVYNQLSSLAPGNFRLAA